MTGTDTVKELTAQGKATRRAKGIALFESGGVREWSSGWAVDSSEAYPYFVAEAASHHVLPYVCNCKDSNYHPGAACKHMWAVDTFRVRTYGQHSWLEPRGPEPYPTPPAPPCPPFPAVDAVTSFRRTLALVEQALLAETLDAREDYLQIALSYGRGELAKAVA